MKLLVSYSFFIQLNQSRKGVTHTRCESVCDTEGYQAGNRVNSRPTTSNNAGECGHYNDQVESSVLVRHHPRENTPEEGSTIDNGDGVEGEIRRESFAQGVVGSIEKGHKHAKVDKEESARSQ